MILSFRHKGLERFFRTGSPAGVQSKHAKRLRLILAQLEQVATIADMNLPGFALHPLKGDRKGNVGRHRASELAHHISIRQRQCRGSEL